MNVLNRWRITAVILTLLFLTAAGMFAPSGRAEANYTANLPAENLNIHLGGFHSPMAGLTDYFPLGTGADNGVIRTVLVSGENLYVGGNFTSIGGCTSGCNGVAKWDGTSWSALGTGMAGNTADVYSLVESGGLIYAGGDFTSAGTCSSGCNSVAKWDGTSWSALASGLDNWVGALVFGGSNLYAGGAFTNHIAKWDGATWTNLGTGISNAVTSLAWDGTNLYAGGVFSEVIDCSISLNCQGIAKWDGTSWSALDTGIPGNVNALAWDGSNLYAGGIFSTAGSCDSAAGCNNIAKWNGSAWSAVGTGMGSTVFGLGWNGTNLYAGGFFTQAGSCDSAAGCNYLAKWDGASWSGVGNGTNNAVRGITFRGADILIGGQFTSAGSCTSAAGCNSIARYGEAPICTASGSGSWNDVFSACSPGSKLVIPAGANVTLVDDPTIISEDLEIQPGATFNPGTKTVILNGGSAQTLTGNPLTFYNLVIDKTNSTDTVTIAGKLKVSSKLTVTKGKLVSGSDYADVQIDLTGTLVLTDTITVSGDWTNNGAFDAQGNTVTFDGSALQTLTGTNSTVFASWVISPTAKVFINTEPIVIDTITNSGTLSQSMVFAPGDGFHFLEISDLGGVRKYQGVNITSTVTDTLGTVSVTIQGNAPVCTDDAGSPPYRHRCFRVNLENAGIASMTFYTTPGEDDIPDPEDLYLFFFGSWSAQTAACGSNPGDPCTRPEIENLSAGDNYFLIAGADSPTAIHLLKFTSRAYLARNWPAVLFFSMACLWIILFCWKFLFRRKFYFR